MPITLLVGSVVRIDHDWETGEDVETIRSEQDVRDHLHIGEYRR